MEKYEALGIVTEIQQLLIKRAQGRATPADYDALIAWEVKAADMLSDPDVLAELRIITNEHNCNGDLEARDGFIPQTEDELAECERFAREELGTETDNHLADVRHFRREPLAAVQVRELQKVVDQPGVPLQKLSIKVYEACSEPYTGPRGRSCTDSTRSAPEAFYVDSQGVVQPLGAASALLARLLEAKAFG